MINPPYMTITLVHRLDITPRSCVINMTEVLNSFFIWAISSRIWACMVTSSAVVGSSAIRSSGLQHMAMAIITLWRIPPESSWGYCFSLRSGLGRPTASSITRAFFSASFLESFWWRIRGPRICSPTVNRGFRLVMGSWNIMPIRLPCIFLISLGDFLSKSSPSKSRASACREALSSSSPIIDSMVTLFPQPDSPTIPRLSPFPTWKVMPLTDCTLPASVAKLVRRFSTSNIVSSIMFIHLLLKSWVQSIPQPVTDKVQGKYGDADCQRRKQHLVRI